MNGNRKIIKYGLIGILSLVIILTVFSFGDNQNNSNPSELEAETPSETENTTVEDLVGWVTSIDNRLKKIEAEQNQFPVPSPQESYEINNGKFELRRFEIKPNNTVGEIIAKDKNYSIVNFKLIIYPKSLKKTPSESLI